MDREPISALLVDDEGFFISLIASQLHDQYGYRTETAFSGKEAIEKIRNPKRAYDVILLDYMMPEVSGLNVLQWMHEQKIETPVVMLTAAGSETVAVESMKMGAYDYLRKEHIDLQRLAIIIQSTHERHLFRISRDLEREKEQEMRLNIAATEKVGYLLNLMAPRLNEDFAAVGVELDEKSKPIRESLSDDLKPQLDAILSELKRHLASIESGVKGLFSLYRVMYARHTEEREIENIRGEFEAKAATTKSPKQ